MNEARGKFKNFLEKLRRPFRKKTSTDPTGEVTGEIAPKLPFLQRFIQSSQKIGSNFRAARTRLAQSRLFQVSGRFYSTKIQPKLAAFDSRFGIREKTAQLLPKSLVETRPRNLNPAGILEWLNQVFTDPKTKEWGISLTILACTWFIADLFALVIDKFLPEPPKARLARSSGIGNLGKPTLESYQVIYSRNLFNSQGLIPGDEETRGGPVSDPGGTPTRTALPFTLVGTLVLEDELRSVATIEDKGVSQVFPVRIQDEIPGKAKIISIEPRKVIFVNPATGRREYIDIPDDGNSRLNVGDSAPKKTGGVAQLSPTQFQISRVEVDKALANLSQVLTQARAVPHLENGQASGFMMTQIVPGSIYSIIGLKDRDILCGLNGEPINDVGKAFEMLGQLRTSSSLELCVKRQGKQMSFNYDIQ